MFSKFVAVLPFVVLSALSVSGSSNNEQCMGKSPMASVSNYLGMELDYNTAEWICCNNHMFAERKGYLEEPQVDFFSKLDPTKEHVFYDSVCGIPLFVAPRGRSFEEFKEESIKHGWPSFRPAEIVSENVIIHPGGRMESQCKTHLGHNLPKNGKDRYCIDLVCIAGMPLSLSFSPMVRNATNHVDNTNTDMHQHAGMHQKNDMHENHYAGQHHDMDQNNGMNQHHGMDQHHGIGDLNAKIVTAEEFDPSTYESSAEEWSGKYPTLKRNLIITGCVVILVALIVVSIGTVYRKKRCVSQQAKKVIAGKEYENKANIDVGTSGPVSPHESDTQSSEGGIAEP